MKWLSLSLILPFVLCSCDDTKFEPSLPLKEDAIVHFIEVDNWIPKTRKLVIYLNIEGGELEFGKCGNPQNNISCVKNTNGEFPPFDGDKEYIEDVISELELLWGNYDVEVTNERPSEDDYVMVIMSVQTLYNDVRADKGLKKIGGVAPFDCGNINQSDTVHVFSNSKREPVKMSNLISHEIGHSLGFGHMSDPTMVMRSRPGSHWVDACVEIIEHQCNRRAWDWCQAGYMNPHKELLGLIGTAK